MECIEKQQKEGKLAGYGAGVADARNLAAVQLYILTGDARWHNVFKETTAFTKVQGRTAKYEQFDQGEAIFAYVQLPAEKTDPTIRKWGIQGITNEANQLIEAGQATAFGWTGSPAIRIGWGRLTSPRYTMPIIYAYRLAGEQKYLAAMVRSCLYATGANPLNLCFTTGVGHRWPEHVFIGDAILTNQQVPPGITPLGPQEWMLLNSWWLNPKARMYPAMKDWPTCEAYIDAGLYTIMSEPTVHNSIAPTLYMWGHLAARPTVK
jgi:endoglucanase